VCTILYVTEVNYNPLRPLKNKTKGVQENNNSTSSR
jgi:hypothetical protein